MKASNLTKLALAVAMALPLFASAESNVVTGANTLAPGARARLDFQVVIPKVLFLQVGTGTLLADNTTIDGVTFTVPAASVGAGSVAAPGALNVRVVGNNGNIALTAATTGALSNGIGDTISFTQITGTGATITHPTFVDGGTSAPVTITPNIGTKVTNLTDTWTFAYANAAVVPPGTYGGVNANNSRVTYTVTMP